jgi:hypothetical protein
MTNKIYILECPLRNVYGCYHPQLLSQLHSQLPRTPQILVSLWVEHRQLEVN